MNNLEKGINKLALGYTCVLLRNEVIYTSTKRGITPLVDFLNNGVELKGFTLADKIVGKAVALLAIYANIEEVYGEVMSEKAISIFKKKGIKYSYKVKTLEIINRKKTGICPMEQAVENIDDENEAFEILNERLLKMSMNPYFSEIKKTFGFGCMRLPMVDNEVDYTEFSKMIKEFLGKGFNYFDTAHGYIEGKSEIAIRECLVKKYPREKYLLTNKLTNVYFNSEGDIEPFFNSQLEACGVEYFDFYLMHAQNKEMFEHFKRCHAYEKVLEFKRLGKIKHFGISFHDTHDVLDRILTEYPQIEVVQIQFNYLDYDDQNVQSKLCYDVCRKHNKPIIVMEPVRGGSLVNIPLLARDMLNKEYTGSVASLAIRFAASFEGMMMVLSGMSNLPQLEDNVSYMGDFKPLKEEEYDLAFRIARVIKNQDLVPCTGCRYCVEGCPKHISIPEVFAEKNAKIVFGKYQDGTKSYKIQALNCIKCGKCEEICPQRLPIREYLEKIGEEGN